jgi:hypothetical protein
MCPLSREPAYADLPAEEALGRLEHVLALGFRRVVLSGGEPASHPAFQDAARLLGRHGVVWDLITTGRGLGDPAQMARLARTGLDRMVISLHGRTPKTHARLCGVGPDAWHEAVAAIREGVEAGLTVLVNCVMQRTNLAELEALARWVATDAGARVGLKLAFPLFDLHGRSQPEVALTYAEVSGPVARVIEVATGLRLDVCLEGFPTCLPPGCSVPRLDRAGFGVTHVLDDADGRGVVAVDAVDSERGVFADACRSCRAAAGCPGIDRRYAARFGTSELQPFT